jgi:hypothetical protein
MLQTSAGCMRKASHTMSDSITPPKRCTHCKIEKPASEFYRDKHAKNGLCYRCKDCMNKTRGFKTRRPSYQECVPEGYKRCSNCLEVKPATREYFVWKTRYGITQPCRECNKTICRDYDLANPEKTKARMQRRDKAVARAYEQRYADRRRELTREFLCKHPEIRRINQQKRRTRKRNLPNDFTKSDWQKCLEYWGNACAYCGCSDSLTIDHFIPFANPICPGTVVDNIVPACQACNFSKHNRDAKEWITWKFGESKSVVIFSRIYQYLLLARDRLRGLP